MKKKLIIKQDGYKECGASSLLSIIRYYNGNISITKLLEYTNTNKDGTTFYNLKIAAEKVGLDAIGYQLDDYNQIFDIKIPFICQIIDNNYEHFLVVYEIKKNKVICMDPAKGSSVINIEEFYKKWTGYILVFQPRKNLLYIKDEKYLNKIIIETILSSKGIVLNIILLSILFTVFSCIYTFYFQTMLNNSNKYDYLVITFYFSIILIIKCISSFIRNELLILLNKKIDNKIFMSTFQKLLLLPYNYYKNKTSGEIISRINDLIYVKNMINKIILTVFLDLFIFIVSGVLLFTISKQMFLLLVIVIMIYMAIYYIFRPVLKKYTNINQQNNATINSFLVETINGFETIKNINLTGIIHEKMKEYYQNALNDNFIYDNYSNLELFLKDIVSLIGILLVELIGFALYLNNNLSIGTFLTFIFISNFFLDPIKSIIDLNKDYYYASNSLNRVNHLFEVDSENLSTKSKYNILGNITINRLSFSYNNNNQVLNNINITINKGDKIMIIGNSGSGKSTLLKLIQKYYDINNKSIYLDDIDVNEYTLKDIRDGISTISQNELIFTDTIYNNITLYRNISNKDFQEVCKITYLDIFVNNMFLRYNTKLEENGLNLSGGQRQRIILARMLLCKSNILLIDEGLNAIDINLERAILKNIFSKYQEKTMIIISHRIENKDLFNKVMKLENGKLSEYSV